MWELLPPSNGLGLLGPREVGTGSEKVSATPSAKALSVETEPKSLEEFKKSHGFDFNAEAITLPAEAKLSVQITEDEKKAIEAKSAPAPEKK